MAVCQNINQSKWQWSIPKFFNIGEACSDMVCGEGKNDQIAMIVEDDIKGTSSITFETLTKKSNQFAEVLKNLKIKKQSRVLIRLPNCLHYPISFLGAMKAACISVPTSTLLTPKEILYLANDSSAEVLVTDLKTWKSLLPMLNDFKYLKSVLISGEFEECNSEIEVLWLDEELNNISSFTQNPKTFSEDPAYLVYTSGTTGYPKGVLHAHRALLGRGPASKYWFNFINSEDRIVHTGKFNWTYVLGSGLMDPLYLGKTVIVHEGKNDADGWINLIKKHKATIFIGVPTIYRQILKKTEANKSNVPTLHHCMSAGEHLSDEIFNSWFERFKLNIYEAVGMSEFSYYISQSVKFPIKPGSAGFPQPGHDVKLLNPETLEEVKTDEEGMICIPENDPGLFIKYWNMDHETSKYKHNNWFFTGDFARYDKEGYLWFLGRKDDIIKSFGYRVSPYEIERVFKSHKFIENCVALGEKQEDGKVLVVIYIILNELGRLHPNQFVQYGRENLAAYKAPKIAYIATEFPKTKNGKILRKKITKEIILKKSDVR